MDDVKPKGGPVRDAMALVGCALGQAVGCTTLIGFSTGSFVYPLTHAFGWSRAQVQSAPAILILTTLFTSFGVGWLSDRVSARWLVGPSQIAFGVCFFLLAAFTTADLRIFYGMHVLLALMAACALPITLNRVIVTRFSRRRGLAVAAMLTGTGICGLVFPPYLSALIAGYGWRTAYVGLGVAVIGVGLLSLILIPREKPERPVLDAGASEVEGVTLGQAVRAWPLWATAVSLLLGGWVSSAVVVGVIPLLRDSGVGPVAASTALSAYGLAVVAGRLLVGALIDKYWAPPVAAIVTVPASLALAYLGLNNVTLVSAVIACVLIGMASGGEANMLSYLPNKYFGRLEQGRIYAFLYIFYIAGIGSAGPTVGAFFDHFHTYRGLLLAAAALWMVSAALLMTFGRYRYRS